MSQSFVVEPLEDRQLMAATPWGAFPRLIDQDAAVASYPTITGKGTSIAILDTGVNYNHPALGGGFGAGHKVVAGYDFVSNDADPIDTDGHGTGVAAIAAGLAYSYNGQKYQGIAPAADIVALRVDSGKGTMVDSRYEAALQWVIDHRAQYNIVAVNISQGGDDSFSYVTTNNSVYADELATLKAAGVFIAVSSGNDGVTSPPGVEYPAADPSTFAIGSVNSADAISSFGNRSSLLALLAPGEGVPTAYLRKEDGDFIIFPADGTSFSSPFAAGMAALMRQVDGSLSPDEIGDILFETGVARYDAATNLTYRRLNVAAALKAVTGSTGTNTSGTLGENGTDNDVVYASTGRLFLAYYDADARSLKYSSRSTAGAWSTVRVVDAASGAGQTPSIALDKKSLAGIAYYDATRGDLKYAHFNGTAWTITTVDSAGTVGQRPSLAYDAAGRPAISYYDATNKDLKLATYDGAKWVRKTIASSGDSGRYSALALNPATRRLALVYENHTYGQFRYGTQGTTGAWAFKTVDDTKSGGGYISLAYDPAKRAAFSYYDAYYGNLKYARLDGTTWRVETIASSGTQGKFSQLMFDPTGSANVVYYDETNDRVQFAFTRANRSTGPWTTITLASNGGSRLAAALSRNDTLSYVFRQDGSDVLHISDLS